MVLLTIPIHDRIYDRSLSLGLSRVSLSVYLPLVVCGLYGVRVPTVVDGEQFDIIHF